MNMFPLCHKQYTGFIFYLLLCALIVITPKANATDSISDRTKKIATERCYGCHGQNGQGNNPTFPKLAGQNKPYLELQINNFKQQVRRGAVMFYQTADLSSNDIVELAAYFNSIPLIRSTTKEGAAIEAGRKLYFGGKPTQNIPACSTCHGPNARGVDQMPRLAGQHAEYIAEQLWRFIDGDRVTGQSDRHPVANYLSNEEIYAVSQFLSTFD